MAAADFAAKRPRISIDVEPDLRRRIRLGAAKRDLSVRQYLLEAIEARLHEDLGDDNEAAVLTAATDPVSAELWDNPRDAAYERWASCAPSSERR